VLEAAAAQSRPERRAALERYEKGLIARAMNPADAARQRRQLARLLGGRAGFAIHLRGAIDAAIARGHADRLLQNARLIQALDPVLAAFVRQSPEMSALLASHPEQLIYRFERYRTKNPDVAANATHQAGFAKDLGRNMAAIVKPLLAEPGGTRFLGQEFNMGVLAGGPAGDRFGAGAHRGNEPGIDIVGFRPAPDITRPPQPTARVEVVLADDKSHAGGKPLVEALTERLTGNLGRQAQAQRAAIDAQRAAGIEPFPQHLRAVEQMEAAAAALAHLDRDGGPWEGGSEKHFLNPDYQREVRRILDQHNITLAITSSMGAVKAVDERLAGYDFVVVH
jgi:hypothetical protein